MLHVEYKWDAAPSLQNGWREKKIQIKVELLKLPK